MADTHREALFLPNPVLYRGDGIGQVYLQEEFLVLALLDDHSDRHDVPYQL